MWQSLLQEAEIAGCVFTEDQQVNLLLGALPDSWGAFVTTQGGINDLTFTALLSNILQQNSINQSKPESSKTSAFYVNGKFIKPQFNKNNQHGKKFNTTKFQSQSPTNQFNNQRNNNNKQIVCHYCGIPGHKAPDCRKKKRDMGQSRSYTNNYSKKEQLHLFTAIMHSSINSSLDWYLDSGTSQHMSPIKSLLRNYETLTSPRSILLGDNSTQNAIGYGSVLLQLSTGQKLLINDILFVPGLAKNLVSVTQITSTGNTIIIFTHDYCIIKTKSPITNKSWTHKISKEGSLFSLGIGIEISNTNYLVTTTNKFDNDTLLWHYRLGHLNIRAIHNMTTNNLVNGLPPIKSNLSLCENCVFGKHPKTSYPTEPVTRATELLALVHTDLCGPMQTPSLGGAFYFLTFIDDYSRFTHIYFLSKKSDTFHKFIQYKNLVENQTSKRILILRSNNGGKFCSKKFDQFCLDHGIVRCPVVNTYTM